MLINLVECIRGKSLDKTVEGGWYLPRSSADLRYILLALLYTNSAGFPQAHQRNAAGTVKLRLCMIQGAETRTTHAHTYK